MNNTKQNKKGEFVRTPNGKHKIYQTHLAASGLTLEDAESLLEQPEIFLLAREQRLRTLLVQTPEDRKEWKRKNIVRWEAIFAGRPCPSWELA